MARHITNDCVGASIQRHSARINGIFFGNNQFEIGDLGITFGEDEEGEAYFAIVSGDGKGIFKLVPQR